MLCVRMVTESGESVSEGESVDGLRSPARAPRVKWTAQCRMLPEGPQTHRVVRVEECGASPSKARTSEAGSGSSASLARCSSAGGSDVLRASLSANSRLGKRWIRLYRTRQNMMINAPEFV